MTGEGGVTRRKGTEGGGVMRRKGTGEGGVMRRKGMGTEGGDVMKRKATGTERGGVTRSRRKVGAVVETRRSGWTWRMVKWTARLNPMGKRIEPRTAISI